MSSYHFRTTEGNSRKQVTPYRLLKVSYISVVDWHQKTDLIHVHPNFHGRERQDCVLVAAGNDEYFFAQLLYVFGVFVANETRHMALIMPMDERIPRDERVQSDKTFRFRRVRARHISDTAFIDVESIVRGAILVKASDSENHDEFIPFDVIDEDMWWRMKSAKLTSRPVQLE